MFMSGSFIQMAQVNPHSECIEYLDELARVTGRLDDKTRKLLVENTKLRRNNEELTSEIVEDLKSEIEDLTSENEELTSENEKLKKQLAEFKQKILQLNFVLKIMGHPQPELEED